MSQNIIAGRSVAESGSRKQGFLGGRRQLKRAGVGDKGGACSPRAKQGQRRAVAHATGGCGHVGCAR